MGQECYANFSTFHVFSSLLNKEANISTNCLSSALAKHSQSKQQHQHNPKPFDQTQNNQKITTNLACNPTSSHEQDNKTPHYTCKYLCLYGKRTIIQQVCASSWANKVMNSLNSYSKRTGSVVLNLDIA